MVNANPNASPNSLRPVDVLHVAADVLHAAGSLALGAIRDMPDVIRGRLPGEAAPSAHVAGAVIDIAGDSAARLVRR